MKKYKIFQKLLSSLAAFPMAFFGYGLARLFIGHWFLPWQVIGGGLLTLGCVVGSMVCGYKAKKLEEQQKNGYTVEKLDVKENSKTVTQENIKTQDLTDNKTINKDNDMEL